MYGPKFIKELEKEYNTKEHDQTKLIAEIDANPKPEINWYKKSEDNATDMVLKSNDKLKLESQPNLASALIKDILMQDAGIYVCAAKNKISEAVSIANLNVFMPPKFIKSPEASTEIELGASIEFKFIIKSYPSAALKFISSSDQSLIESSDDGQYTISSSKTNDYEDEYTFKLSSVTPETPISFECKASNTVGEALSKFSLNVTRKPEFITKPLDEIILIESKETLIECSVLASPEATLTWIKDGVKLAQNKRIQFIEDKSSKYPKSKSHTMKILSASKDDFGTYEIIASNKLGEASCTFKTLVEYPPQVIKDLRAKEKCVDEDDTFLYECTIKGSPKPQIKWFMDDKELLLSSESSNYKFENSPETDTYKLIIEKLSISKNTGKYKAVASNPLGTVSTTSSVLDIDLKPVIVPKFSHDALNLSQDSCDYLIEENKSLDLEFEVNGKPEPSVEHLKDGTKFKPSEKRVSLVKKENLYKLSLPDVKTTDGGAYKLNAKNSCGEKSFTINLKIKSGPKFVKTFKNKIELLENNKLELVATLMPGVFPSPVFKWFKNDELLDENLALGYLITTDESKTFTSLIIDNLTLSHDQSKFKLEVSNEFGKCENETQLDVLSVPKFKSPLNDCQTVLNNEFEWSFEIDATPEPKLKFLKNDREFNFKDNRLSLVKENETIDSRNIYKYKIKYQKIQEEDFGAYRVEAVNKAGEAKSQGQLVVTGAPCFIKKPVDTSVVLNKPGRVECEIAGIPTPDIEWFKNGEPLIQNDRVKIENKLKTMYWINIRNALKEDTGVYTVKISNPSGKADCTFYLDVHYGPEIVQPLITDLQLIEGNKLELSARINANPRPSIIWIRNKVSLQEEIDNEHVKLVENDNEYKLVIDNCLWTDSGTYVIKAKNPIAEVSSQSQIVIHTVPKFIKHLTLISSTIPVSLNEINTEENPDLPCTKLVVNEKSQIKLECQITGLPKPTIKWFKNENEELKSSDKIKLENKNELYTVIIKDCNTNDQAVYTIQAENAVGVSKHNLILDMNCIPLITKALSNTEVVLDKSPLVELECGFKSKPAPEITWFIGDKQITAESNERFSILSENSSSKLIIENPNLEDSGFYKIKLKNPAGEAISNATFSVLKPAQITLPLPETLNIVEKSEIKLECHINDSVPKSTITWHRDNTQLNASKRILIGKPVLDPQTGSHIYTLTITDAALNDSGLYYIKASNTVKTVESKCQLNVISPPRIIKDLKPTLECNENDNLRLEVTASGKPCPEFKWYKFNNQTNSQELVENTDSMQQSVQSDSVFSLNLTQIRKEMQGKYTLVLSNEAGSVETKCDLTINGKILLFSKLNCLVVLYKICLINFSSCTHNNKTTRKCDSNRRK